MSVPARSPSPGARGGAAPTTPAALRQAMQSAVQRVTSAHLAITATVAGQSLTGAGDERLSDGKVTGLTATEKLPAGTGTVQIIVVGGKTYVKLPRALNPTGKPYLVVRPNSSNPVIRQIAGALDSAVSSASMQDVEAFVGAARAVRNDGPAMVDGVRTTHYTVVVDAAKLPAALPARQHMPASGVGTIPVQLYLDSTDRPVRVSDQVTVQGQKVATDVVFSRYDEPVTITAPPAGQVGG